MKHTVTMIKGEHYLLPFSKEILMKDLLFCGFNIDNGYKLAQKAEKEINSLEKEKLLSQTVRTIIRNLIAAESSAAFLERYDGWQKLRYSNKPIVILLGGVSGVGKSSIARELGYHLDIKRIIGTDTIRQIMRMTFTKEFMPAIHTSSFESAHRENNKKNTAEHKKKVWDNFTQQAEYVLVGVKAILNRSVDEKLSTIIEGVHLPPLLCEKIVKKFSKKNDIIIKYFLLTTADKEQHTNHFIMRDCQTGSSRKADIYLSHLDNILDIQNNLQQEASRVRAHVVDTGDMNQSIKKIISTMIE